MNKGDLVEKVARAIYDATDPLSGDPVAVVIHMSDLLHWEGVASGQMMPDIERQKLAIMEVCRAAATAAIGVCQAEAADEIARLREALGKDRDRLDFLDECNRRLNARYGTNYGWKLVLNHNVNRLFLGDHLDVDLNDSHGGKGKLPSCRAAIDKEMDRITALQHKEPQG